MQETVLGRTGRDERRLLLAETSELQAKTWKIRSL